MPIINPQRSRHEPTIAGPCLLIINPDEMKAAMAMLRRMGAIQHRLYNGELWQLPDSQAFVAGPAVGAPVAVMTAEKLLALGCRSLYIYGWCGALHQSLHSGDLLLPCWGISEEGTSCHYPLAQQADSSPALRRRLVTMLAGHGHCARPGKVWTTDAPYRELREKITSYAQQGIVAVDMEFTALATVAAFRGAEMAGLFLTSDELYHEHWQPAFTSKKFRQQSRCYLEILLNWMNEYE